MAGPVTAGDTLTTAINGVAVPYPSALATPQRPSPPASRPRSTPPRSPDPYSGLPLNGLVVASSAAAVITITAANAGAPFTLACALDPANAGTYAAAPPVPASPDRHDHRDRRARRHAGHDDQLGPGLLHRRGS